VLSDAGGDRGSVLILYACGVLIVIVLGAIAADLSHAYMAKRDLIELAGTIANDVSTAGLDQDVYLHERAYVLDGSRVSNITASALQRSSGDTFTPAISEVALVSASGANRCAADEGRCRVRVTATAHVEYLFGRALPGVGHVDVRVTSYATLEEG
jgi:hypothetical protein